MQAEELYDVRCAERDSQERDWLRELAALRSVGGGEGRRTEKRRAERVELLQG